MGVNHSLLPVTDAELTMLLATPGSIHDFVDSRRNDVRELLTDGLAIISLTCESDDDPLRFMQSGNQSADEGSVSGWVGNEDMGYGPASYYKNQFVRIVARKLEPWTLETFIANCDMEWLDANRIYPSGNWLE